MSPAHHNHVLTYIFAFLTLIIHVADTITQWHDAMRSKKSLSIWSLALGIVLLIEIGLVYHIELKTSGQESVAFWTLLEVSVLLNLALEFMAVWRFSRISEYYRWIKIASLSVAAIVLVLDSTAFILLVTEYHLNLAVIFQALGNSFTFAYTYCIAVWIFNEGDGLKRVLEKMTWRMFCIMLVIVTSGAMSLGLLVLPQVFQKQMGQLIAAFVPGLVLTVLQAL